MNFKWLIIFITLTIIPIIFLMGETIPDLSLLLYEAQRAYDSGDLTTALSKFEEVLLYEKNNYDALLGCADINLDREEYKIATEYYKSALKIEGTDPFVWRKYVLALEKFMEPKELTKEYLNWAQVDYDEPYPHKKLLEIYQGEGKTDKVIEQLEILKGFGPLNYDDYIKLGEFNEEKGLIDTAIDNYQDAVEIDMQRVEAHLKLGDLYWRNDRLVEAENEFSSVIQNHPDNQHGHFGMGMVLYEQGNNTGAIDELEIVLSPSNANASITELGDTEFFNALKTLSDLYVSMGRYNEAIDLIDRGRELGFEDTNLELLTGKTYFEMGSYNEAIESLERSISLNKQLTESYSLLGTIYLEQNDFERAISILESGVKISPDDYKLRVLLGESYYRLGELQKSEGEYKRAKNINSGEFEPYFRLGMIYLDMGEYQKATEEFNIGLSIDKTSATPHLYLGEAYLELKEFSKAKDVLENSILIDDKNPQTYKYLGLVYLRQEKYEEAIPEFQRALQLDNSLADVHFYLGNSLEALMNYLSAIEEYETALEIEPDSAEYLTSLGRTYYLNGNIDDAEDCLARSYEMSDTLYDTPYYLGRILEDRKDLEGSIEYYYKAIDINPLRVEAKFRLARLLFLENRSEEAKGILEETLKANPDSIETHGLLAIVYEDLNLLDEALNEHKTLNKLEPENPLHLKNIGYIERLRGKYTGAIDALNRALELTQSDADIYEMLGDLYRILGFESKKWKRYDEELNYYQKASDMYIEFLVLNPTPENLTYINEFLEGFKRYKSLPLEERQRIEFHLWW